jgi:N-acetylmuramoyl-L-alanine amidase
VKLHWLLISSLAITGLVVSPAAAGKRLTSWRFYEDQNRLTFRTAQGVQPRAQLISDPTRVVIDLPRTSRGETLRNQLVGGAIKEVRVGQFTKEITRLVIELAAGYTLDPDQITVQGETPQQWSVQLPAPQRQRQETADQRSQRRDRESSPLLGNTDRATSPSQGESQFKHPKFWVTGSGFLLRLNQPPSEEMAVERSEDQRRISIRLPQTALPSDLPRAIPINQYGVAYAEFKLGGNDTPAEVILHVNESSPDWGALPKMSGDGGVVMLPQGGMRAVQPLAAPPIPDWVQDIAVQAQPTKVEAVDLVDNQLLIQATRSLKATGKWDRISGIYEITIADAQLADPVRGPELTRNSPISQIRVREEDNNQVVVQIQAASGVHIDEQMTQPREHLLAIEWRQAQFNTATTRSQQPQQKPIPVPQPQRESVPTPTLSGDKKDQPLIVIDPGHGGKDPGAIGIGGLQEKDVVLPISRYVSDILAKKGVRVKILRERDRFITLSGRTEIANQADANLFVSIHANAISMSRPDVNGVETYYYSSGRWLAAAIQQSMLRNLNMRDRGVRQANFYVLRNSAMPAVLVETGFVTGREDAPRLADDQFRREMAAAIAEGILKYVQAN